VMGGVRASQAKLRQLRAEFAKFTEIHRSTAAQLDAYIAVAAWCRDKLEKEMKNTTDRHTRATMRAVVEALSDRNPKLRGGR